ncbi:MAG: methionine gamma-lyase family protein [Bacilli bacterium]|nr:methionine gamma-lyase family protein [Bacilli bacterium]
MNIDKYFEDLEQELLPIYQKYEKICELNSEKVLKAFIENKVGEEHFSSSTGYGYGDLGRDVIESIYKDIFKSEDALVRNQFISGTHALQTTLFGILRPNDLLLSINGDPYDTLQEVIGIRENPSSLKAFGVLYNKIDLKDGEFDKEEICKFLKNNKVKMLMIQRSKGYSTRKSFTIEKVQDIIGFIRQIDKEVIIMVDNCYCEFVSDKEPIEIGADICVGSLIKNLGGTIANNGAYVVGRKTLVNLVAERLNVIGQGKEVGPSLGANKYILQGLANAPRVVFDSIKSVILTSRIMQDFNVPTEPLYNEEHADIVLSIIFNDKNLLKKYVNLIQANSLIDSKAYIEETEMPGYEDKIVMASGSFVSGSSIELSCDGPLREPYIAYQQGSFSYYYNKIALKNIVRYFKESEK